MPIARIEHQSSLLRIYDSDNAVHGDAFQFFIAVQWLSPVLVKLKGLVDYPDGKRFTFQHVSAIRAELKRLGVLHFEFERYTNGGHRVVRGRV